MKAQGFTLIELSLVLLLVAVAAAAVTLRMQGVLRQVGMEQAAACRGHVVPVD